MYNKKLVALYFGKLIEGKKLNKQFWDEYQKEDIIEIFRRIVKNELRLATEYSIRKYLNKSVISRFRLSQPIKKFFNNNYFELVDTIYPGFFKPWQFPVSKNFWNNEKNIIDAVKWMVEERLQYTTPEQKLSITGTDYENNGLIALKYIFAGCLNVPILLAYPELGEVPCTISSNRLSSGMLKHVGVDSSIKEYTEVERFAAERLQMKKTKRVSYAKQLEMVRNKINPDILQLITDSFDNRRFSQVMAIIKEHDGIPKACSVDKIVELINTIIPIACKYELDIKIMLAVIIFHDYGYVIGSGNYEVYSQKLFNNHSISRFFSEYERSIITTAIAQCRYKPNNVPTNTYAKLLWDFKKPTDMTTAIKASINVARHKRFGKDVEVLVVKKVLKDNFLNENYTTSFFEESRQMMESVLTEVVEMVKNEIQNLNKYKEIIGGNELCC